MSKGFWIMLKEDNNNRTTSQIIDHVNKTTLIYKSERYPVIHFGSIVRDSTILNYTHKVGKWARKGALLVPIAIPIFTWKTRTPNIANMLWIKNSRILITSVSKNALVESKWWFAKWDLSLPNTRYTYLYLR